MYGYEDYYIITGAIPKEVELVRIRFPSRETRDTRSVVQFMTVIGESCS